MTISTKPSRSSATVADPVGPKHAKLLEFLATRGQVEFDAKQIKRWQQLLKQARAELLGPLPQDTTVAIIDGWVRRITLKCSEAAGLWAEIATAPALAQVEEIEVVVDDGLEAWIEAARQHPQRVTRFYLNADFIDQDTGEIFDESDRSTEVVAAANALRDATELVLGLYLHSTSSLAGLDLPQLTSLAICAETASGAECDAAVLRSLTQADCPQLRRVAWESRTAMDPSVVASLPPQWTELGFWGPNHAAVQAALVAGRPSLTAFGMSDHDRDDPDAPGDEALLRLAEGRRLFGPRCAYIKAFNTGHRLLHALERREDALEHFAALRGRNCRDVDVHFQYAYALEDDHEVVNAYCEALLIDPDHEATHNNLGNALRRLGRPRLALYHLLRSLEAMPDYREGWSYLAEVYRELGQEDDARAAEARAVGD